MKQDAWTDNRETGTDAGRLCWWVLLGALALYGVFFVFSTGYIGEEYPIRPTWTRHAVWLSVGMIASVLIAKMHPNGPGVKIVTWSGYLVSILGLLLVLVAGRSIGGARRWLVVGPAMLQPAEFAKLFTLMAVSRVVCPSDVPKEERRTSRYLFLVPLVVIPVVLIGLEPSYGNAFSLLPGVGAIICIHVLDGRLWGLVLLFIGALLIVSASCVIWLRGQSEETRQAALKGRYGLRDYQVKRIASYLTPQGGWNERQSVMTLASGGLTGKGYLRGTMKSLGYLPRTVAPTDFIFSVIGEEMGYLFGTFPIVLLYGGVLLLGLHWAGNTSEELLCLNSVGILTLVLVHVLINVGMTIRLVPVIGLPLPLLSYGGSFTLAICMGLGLVYSAGLHRDKSFRQRGNLQESVPRKPDSRFTVNLLGLAKITLRSA